MKIKFNDFVNESNNVKKTIIVKSKYNNLFHYDIYLDENNKVIQIDNEWDVSELPVWKGMNFDIVLLQDYITRKRPEFYII